MIDSILTFVTLGGFYLLLLAMAIVGFMFWVLIIVVPIYRTVQDFRHRNDPDVFGIPRKKS